MWLVLAQLDVLRNWKETETFHPAKVVAWKSNRQRRVTSRTAGYDCVNNATVCERKGGDPKNDHAKKGTARTPGWHPEGSMSHSDSSRLYGLKALSRATGRWG